MKRKPVRKAAPIEFSSSYSDDEPIKKVPVKRTGKGQLVDVSDDSSLSSMSSAKTAAKGRSNQPVKSTAQPAKSQPRAAAKPAAKAAPKAQEKAAPKAQEKAAPKAQEKASPKPQEKASPKAQEKASPKPQEKKESPKAQETAAPKTQEKKESPKTQEKKDKEYSYYSYDYSYESEDEDANRRRTEAKTPRPRTAADRFPLFRCHRNKGIGRLGFEYYDRQNLLFTCQRKGSKFTIFKAGETDGIAVFTADRHKKNFVLTDAQTGKEMATIKFTQTLVNKPRDVDFVMRNGDAEVQFVNQQPMFNERKFTWQLDFGARFVEPSQKNVVLLDKDNELALIVYKLKDEDLQVEVATPVDSVLVFFFAAASFVCPF